MLALTINGATTNYDDARQGEAMAAYWAAKQDGDATAKLKRIDSPLAGHEPMVGAPRLVPTMPLMPDPITTSSTKTPLPALAPASAPSPAVAVLASAPRVEVTTPAAGPTVETRRGDVSVYALQRIQRHQELLANHGIVLPPPVYAPGSKVLAVGDSNFRISRKKWEDQPEIIDQLRKLWFLIRREQRRDHVVPLSAVKFCSDGAIDFGGGPIFCEGQAMTQLLSISKAFPKGATYLTYVDPDLRKYNWDKRRENHMDLDKEIKLRVRFNPLTNTWGVFAAVGKGYGVMDVDEMCNIMAPSFADSGLRGTVVYDSATTNLRIDATYHADKIIDLAAGDVFQVGVQLRANDSGKGGIWLLATALRNLCLNLIILGLGKKALYYTRHVGDMSRVADDITASMGKAEAMFEPFAEEWNILRNTPVDAIFPKAREQETGKLVTDDIFLELAKTLDGGVRRDAMVEALLRNYDAEPGESMADIVNAVTRTHLSTDIDNWHREKIEEQSRELVAVWAKQAAPASAMAQA